MKNLEQYLNYAFEIYDHDGKLFDKIEGPGHNGNWLSQPNSPCEAAIIPVPSQTVEGKVERDVCYRVVRIPLDEIGKEKVAGKEEMFLFEARSEQEAKQLARELNCDYMYWSEWDGCRVIVIISVDCDEPWYKLSDSIRYIDEY